MKLFFRLLTLFLFQISVFSETPERILKEIDEIISAIPASTKTAIMIYNPLTQDTILSINHTETMIPASNTKLFTSAVALELMGGEFELSTKFLSKDDDLSDGIINGDIFIKGYGNPLFDTDDLDSLVKKLHESGLRKITGDVVGDDTYFDKSVLH